MGNPTEPQHLKLPIRHSNPSFSDTPINSPSLESRHSSTFGILPQRVECAKPDSQRTLARLRENLQISRKPLVSFRAGLSSFCCPPPHSRLPRRSQYPPPPYTHTEGDGHEDRWHPPRYGSPPAQPRQESNPAATAHPHLSPVCQLRQRQQTPHQAQPTPTRTRNTRRIMKQEEQEGRPGAN